MSEAIRSLGLCSTCRHALVCMYPRDPKRPVFDCEEFEIEVKPSGREVVSSSDSDEDDFARYKGLCSNCDNRESCMYPKPEGGVWHCEEYQ